MYSLYGAAAQRARHVESVVALHGSDSGLHGPGGPQQGHAGVCGGEVAVPLEPCLEREREREVKGQTPSKAVNLERWIPMRPVE